MEEYVRIYFICPAKCLTVLDDGRIYFICTAKFLTFSGDGEIWYDLRVSDRVSGQCGH